MKYYYKYHHMVIQMVKERNLLMGGKILKLRGLIYGKFETEAALAQQLGWTRQRLSKITNGKKVPSIYEAKEIADALSEDIETVAECFTE